MFLIARDLPKKSGMRNSGKSVIAERLVISRLMRGAICILPARLGHKLGQDDCVCFGEVCKTEGRVLIGGLE